MRKYFLLFAFVLSAIVTGCSSDDETDGNGQIKVDDKNSLTQTVYADNNEGKSGVKFTTTGAWTSTIKETGTQKVLLTGYQLAPITERQLAITL